MASARLGGAALQVHRLFDEGTASGLSDGQLLERFARSRDERAFEAIVARHGPMVLATCRAVLKDRHASEDAFQSAFASLVRRASTLRDADALGGWLHRVAYREALRAGSEAARRRAIEREAPPRPAAREADLGDLRAVVHAELDRLPDPLRLPLVLCDLEGLTKGQAAHHLGWTEATVRGRLERGRNLLRSRLGRRGWGVPAAWVVGPGWGEVPIGPALAASAIRAASAVVPTVPRLAVGFPVAAAIVVLVGLAGFGMGSPGKGTSRTRPRPPDPPEGRRPRPIFPGKPWRSSAGWSTPSASRWRGRRSDSNRRRARCRPSPEPTATTDLDGRFSARGLAGRSRGPEPAWGAQVIAFAPGFGPGRAHVGHVAEKPGEVTVRLAVDDLPIEGRVVDLEGRAVAGSTVRVKDLYLSTGTADDLARWLDKVRQYGIRGPWEGTDTGDLVALYNVPGLDATAGPDGRFRLAGVGRDRVATLLIGGPGIATTEVLAMTRPGPAIRTVDRGPGEESLTFHPARFDQVALPTRAVEGVVTDKVTGAPLAGIKVEGRVFDEENNSIPAPGVGSTTGPDGRYRLDGLAQSSRYKVFARPAPDRPYIPASLEADAGPVAPSAVKYDVPLKRGVQIRGRITDKATGRPINRAVIYSYTFTDNPHVDDYPGYRRTDFLFARTDADGRYEVTTLPGRGLIAVKADHTRYLPAKGLDGIAGYDPKQLGSFSTYPSICRAGEHHAIAEVDPRPGAGPITVDLQVDPGGSMAGTVVDPEGREINDLVANRLTPFGILSPSPQESGHFEAIGVDPDRPRRAFFFHQARQLAGSIVIPGDLSVVKLQPWGS